jgi:hypothetical protein
LPEERAPAVVGTLQNHDPWHLATDMSNHVTNDDGFVWRHGHERLFGWLASSRSDAHEGDVERQRKEKERTFPAFHGAPPPESSGAVPGSNPGDASVVLP